MKKILLFVFLLIAIVGNAQYPVTITSGNSSTLQRQLGSYGGNLGYVFTASYGDTTAANLSFIKNVPGQVIRVVNDLWMRSNDVTTWIKLNAAAVPGTDNTNIGIGYRLLVPSSQGIKTLFNSYAFNWDSTSNANGLTGKIDTTLLFSNISNQFSDGDTTVFETVLDSTAQPGQRVLFSGGSNRIRSDSYFLYDSVNNKLMINHFNISAGGPNTKLFVNGNATLSGNTTSGSFIKSGGTQSQFLKADGSVTTLTGGIDIIYTTGTGVIDADTTTGATKLATQGDIDRAIAAGASTLQNVFNTEVGGSVLTKNDTIDINSRNLRFEGTSGLIATKVGISVLDDFAGGGQKLSLGYDGSSGALSWQNVSGFRTTLQNHIGTGYYNIELPNTGNATDTLATLFDIRAGGGSGGFFNPDQTSTGNTAHDANYKSFDVTKMLSGHWKAGTGVNYMDEAYDSTYHAMVVNKGSDFYGWEANATTGNKYMKIYARTTSVDNAIIVYGDSTAVSQRLSYPSNIHGTFTQYSLVDKKYADSAISAGVGTLKFAESVVKSNDSVYLRGEKALPPVNNTAYSVMNNVQGHNPIAILNVVAPEQDDLLHYDADNNEWDNFRASLLNGKMEFIVDDPNFPNPGDSILVDSNFMDRHVEIYRDGDFQYRNGATYYYETDSIGGQITFHPPLMAEERITIFTSPITHWAYLSRREAESPPVFTDFDYNPAHELEELTTDNWTPTAGGSSPYTAVADAGLKIPSGINGAYRVQTGAFNSAIFGLDATSTSNAYANYDYWAEPSADNQIRVGENTGGSTITGFTWASGDYIAIWRIGSTVTCQKSSDGTTWITVYTFSATTSGDLYPKADVFSGSYKIFNPQAWHLE